MSQKPQFNQNQGVYVAEMSVGDGAVLIGVVEAESWSIRVERDGHSVELLSRRTSESPPPMDGVAILRCALVMERLQAVLNVL